MQAHSVPWQAFEVSPLDVLVLVCRYWMGTAVEAEYQQLAALASAACGQVLLELTFGQLLSLFNQSDTGLNSSYPAIGQPC
jgi:hypothetical protein